MQKQALKHLKNMSQIGRLFDIPYHQLQNYPLEKAFSTKYNLSSRFLSQTEQLWKSSPVASECNFLGKDINSKLEKFLMMPDNSSRRSWTRDYSLILNTSFRFNLCISTYKPRNQ